MLGEKLWEYAIILLAGTMSITNQCRWSIRFNLELPPLIETPIEKGALVALLS
jgi:hypothetical protein